MRESNIQLRSVTWRQIGSSHRCGIDPGVQGVAGDSQVGLVELVRLGPAERTVAQTLLNLQPRVFVRLNFFPPFMTSLKKVIWKGRDGGIVVSIHAFDSDNPSLNPAGN